jgi:hypothetical protein
VEELIVMIFPAVPVATKLVTVCVAPLLRVTVLGALIVNVFHVLALVNATAPVPAPVIEILL